MWHQTHISLSPVKWIAGIKTKTKLQISRTEKNSQYKDSKESKLHVREYNNNFIEQFDHRALICEKQRFFRITFEKSFSIPSFRDQ